MKVYFKLIKCNINLTVVFNYKYVSKQKLYINFQVDNWNICLIFQFSNILIQTLENMTFFYALNVFSLLISKLRFNIIPN